jgi:hypothetical protein
MSRDPVAARPALRPSSRARRHRAADRRDPSAPR